MSDKIIRLIDEVKTASVSYREAQATLAKAEAVLAEAIARADAAKLIVTDVERKLRGAIYEETQ